MKENIKYVAKLASISIVSFFKINVIGLMSTVLFGVAGFLLFTTNTNLGHSGHAGAIASLLVIYQSNPISSVVFYLLLVSSPIVFFILGNSYITKKLVNKLIRDNSESYIYPMMDSILAKLKISLENQEFSHKELKDKFIQLVRNEGGNKWIRRIIALGLKKARIDEIDFSAQHQSIDELIKLQLVKTLESVPPPSRKPIWLLLMLQWGFLFLVWISQ